MPHNDHAFDATETGEPPMSNPFAQTAKGNSHNTALWVDDVAGWDEAAIPHRPWIAPGFLLRRTVTLLIGPPSAMKSTLLLAWATSLALGRPLGTFIPCGPAKVLSYSVEDDRDEQRRRRSAMLRQFNACSADIAGKIICSGPRDAGTLFHRDLSGRLAPTAAMEQLRDLVNHHQPDVLMVDPLVETHGDGENDNTAQAAVMAAFRALAGEYDLSVALPHHTRKGDLTPGDPDVARGASSIIGAARIVKTLLPMPVEDAQKFGLPEDRKNRNFYFRLDDAKQNYAAIGDADWFEKTLYRLDNGEIVPAIVPWDPPNLWAALTPSVASKILDALDAGLDGGQRRFTDSNAATDRAAWPIVKNHLPVLSETQCRAVINEWVKNGMLCRQKYDDPLDRKERSGLVAAKRPGALH